MMIFCTGRLELTLAILKPDLTQHPQNLKLGIFP